MLAGVTIVDPATTWIEPAVVLEPDATIHPFTVLRGQTRVARGAEVGPHAVAVDAEIGQRVLVGPFCYLRPGTFSRPAPRRARSWRSRTRAIGDGTKVPHLSYLGDADIGAGTNIAAGNITANFPHRAGQAEGTDDDRRQRQDRHPQCARGARRDWRRCLDCGGIGHHQDVPPGALAVPEPADNKEGYLRGDDD